jgi:hypothetical protein
MKYQAKIRIPRDQYAFIEVDAEGTLDEIKLLYHDLMTEDEGLDDKAWRNCLDKYLTDGNMESVEYENMSTQQQRVIQEIKKSFKRLNYNKE